MGVYYKHDAIPEEIAPEIPANESYVDPIQLSIDACAIEHKLFEAVIETDFAELYKDNGAQNINESTIEYIREASVEGIINAAKALFERVVGAIKKFFEETLPTAITNVVTKNKLILKKYKGKVTSQAIKEKGKDQKEGKFVNADKLKELLDTADKYFQDLKSSATKDGGLDELKANIEKFVESVNKKEYVVSGKYADNANNIDGSDYSVVSLVEKGYSVLRKYLNKCENDLLVSIKTQYELVKKMQHGEGAKVSTADQAVNTAEEASQIAQAEFDKMHTIVQIANNLQSAVKSVCMEVIKVSRLSYIRCGMLATGEKVEEAEDEKVSGDVVDKDGNPVGEAFDYLIDLTNDTLVEEAFAF